MTPTEILQKAMQQAFLHGQTYWQQADSDSPRQHQKTPETERKFQQLVVETCAALAEVSSAHIIDAAEKLAALYDDDDRQDIKTDVMNSFYAGVRYAAVDIAQVRRERDLALRAAHHEAGEVNHWRANHADQVTRCALLRQREDLPVDRIPAYAELVRLQEVVAATRPLPNTPAEAIDFIGSHFDAMTEADDLTDVRFTLSVHDLLSACSNWIND